MHVAYVHKSFPAQFGHVAERLIEKHGFRCSFVTEKIAANTGRIEIVRYGCPGGATRTTHIASRGLENSIWRSHAVLAALRNRADIRPDLIVGHSGFGSTLFLRDFYSCPIVNFCEWFYREAGSDSELSPSNADRSGTTHLTNRCRNAMLLADLDACALGYCPTNWQRSRIPHEYQHKLATIFDGIDTRFWRPLSRKERGRGRWIAGKWVPWRKRLVTYVSRGFESIRGFDVFMEVARRICERRKDVVFLCIGSDRVCYGGDMAEIQEKSFRDHVLKNGRFDLDRFIFTGPIPPEELRRVFAYSDLHIYLTVPFILSWSLMDALACGCTVLVSDTPPLREVIEHGRNGLMAPFCDMDRLAELALEVLADPRAYRRTLGEAGLATIHEKYDLDVVLPRMIRLYERAIKRDIPRPGDSDGGLASSNGSAQESRTGVPPISSATQDSKPITRSRIANWLATRSGRGIGLRTQGGHAAKEGSRDGRPVACLSPAEQATLRGVVPATAKLILELGAWRGETTKFLAEHCPDARILAVDTWHGGEFHQPLHPDWKALLPDVWDSFVERTRPFGHRIIPIRNRHDDAVREAAARGLAADVIYYDPDYDSQSLRRTLAALVRAFPSVALIGHDWLWHRVQEELSLASRRTGRKLDARGNMWRLEAARVQRRSGAPPVPGGAYDSASNGKSRTVAQVTGRNGNPTPRDSRDDRPIALTRRDSGPILDRPLRVLVTIPHYYRPNASRMYGSGVEARDRRAAAVRMCLSSLYETLGGVSYTASLARPENLRANSATAAHVHVVLCTSGENHLLGDLKLPARSFERRQVAGDPLFLGYACHEVLRERLGEFDYYVYLEDDLVLGDPWVFAKLRWFRELAGEECVLQPNRYEVSENGACRKCYIDGDLDPDKTARYQDVTDRPELVGDFLGSRVVFGRPLNPHAGCFFLTSDQMRTWSEQAYFLDRDATFYSPLEGAATVGVMRTFRVYKPVRENANFFEIRHMGDAWLQKLATRDQTAIRSQAARRAIHETASNGS